MINHNRHADIERTINNASLVAKATGIALVLGLAQCAHKAHAADMPALEYGYVAAATADMLTTLDIHKHKGYTETNSLLGTHPSDSLVVGYFAATTALHAAITYELVSQDVPMPVVKAWEYVTIGIEAGYAVHNYSIGLRFTF
jgi:hypothetical protein